MDTKFCYFNNYNINRPRHYCRNCQRYWTAGGTLRNVPVGAGRRKNKNANQHNQLLSDTFVTRSDDPAGAQPLPVDTETKSFSTTTQHVSQESTFQDNMALTGGDADPAETSQDTTRSKETSRALMLSLLWDAMALHAYELMESLRNSILSHAFSHVASNNWSSSGFCRRTCARVLAMALFTVCALESLFQRFLGSELERNWCLCNTSTCSCYCCNHHVCVFGRQCASEAASRLQ